MKAGDVVVTPFPFTDLTEYKIRPAVLLFVGETRDCILAFISSKHSAEKFSFKLLPTKENGLKVVSTVYMDKLATIDTKLVLGRIGTLSEKDKAHIKALLKKIFSLL